MRNLERLQFGVVSPDIGNDAAIVPLAFFGQSSRSSVELVSI